MFQAKNVEPELKRILKDNRKVNKLQLADIQIRIQEIIQDIEAGKYDTAEVTATEVSVILEFLFITKELTLEEYNNLCIFVNVIANEGQRRREEQEA